MMNTVDYNEEVLGPRIMIQLTEKTAFPTTQKPISAVSVRERKATARKNSCSLNWRSFSCIVCDRASVAATLGSPLLLLLIWLFTLLLLLFLFS